MCEFCHRHGEGKKWYLQARNYSEDLLSDVHRRRNIERFVGAVDLLANYSKVMDQLERSPRFLKNLASRLITNRMKRIHFGQILPIEEVEEVFSFVNSIIRMSCLCRKVTLGKEKRYCYGITLNPAGGVLAELLGGAGRSYHTGVKAGELETIGKDEALEAFRDHEKEGLCHSIWTFQAPFIGGICNCDRADCMAMHFTLSHRTPLFFKAEYIAVINDQKCSGCRRCQSSCPFDGFEYHDSKRTMVVRQDGCYGCGICRNFCESGAITLIHRPAEWERIE